ncbi:MAG TPA: hypothetical protein VFA18_03800 [Gemmataceae bacterium]|nr:hypothetical protein [Gemmataceae bacterium]
MGVFLPVWFAVTAPGLASDLPSACAGAALVLVVHAGASPALVEQLFGPPDLCESDRSGPLDCVFDWPVRCWYLRYGAVVGFRQSQFPIGATVRVRAGIE